MGSNPIAPTMETEDQTLQEYLNSLPSRYTQKGKYFTMEQAQMTLEDSQSLSWEMREEILNRLKTPIKPIGPIVINGLVKNRDGISSSIEKYGIC